MKVYKPEDIEKKVEKLESDLHEIFKKASLKHTVPFLLKFYGGSFFTVDSDFNHIRQFFNAEMMISKLLMANKGKKTNFIPDFDELTDILYEYEENSDLLSTFGYHDTEEITDFEDLFFHPIPREMREVDCKRVITDWFEFNTKKCFPISKDEDLIRLLKKSRSSREAVRKTFGHDYKELLEVQKKISEILTLKALQGLNLPHKVILEKQLFEMQVLPLTLVKKRFLRALKDKGINKRIFTSPLADSDSFANYEEVISNAPYKGAFIEIDKKRCVTSTWWHGLVFSLGYTDYVYRQSEPNMRKNVLGRAFELKTSEVMKNNLGESFKLTKPIEIDAIGIKDEILIIIENIYTFLPLQTRSSFRKSVDASVKGRIGNRFLKKLFQLDERQHWFDCEGLDYLRKNPHYRKKVNKVKFVIPMIVMGDKEMLPDKIGDYLLFERKSFTYLTEKLSEINLQVRESRGIKEYYLPDEIFYLLSSSMCFPRTGEESILLPSSVSEISLKTNKIYNFLNAQKETFSDTDKSFLLRNLMNDLKLSEKENQIVLANLTLLMRQIYLLNINASRFTKSEIKNFLSLIDNIISESYLYLREETIDGLFGFNDEEKSLIAHASLNYSNCHSSSLCDSFFISFLSKLSDYPIELNMPGIFITDIKLDNLLDIESRSALLENVKSAYKLIKDVQIKDSLFTGEAFYQILAFLVGKDFMDPKERPYLKGR